MIPTILYGDNITLQLVGFKLQTRKLKKPTMKARMPCAITIWLIGLIRMEEKKIDWEQRRYELAKAAMQALISNSFFMKNLGMYLDEHPDKKMDAIEVVAIESINYVDAMIKKLKGE